MRRTLAVLAVVAFASLFPKPSEALPCGREIDHIYYNDCGPGPKTIVGEVYTDCDGNTSSWGVTSPFEERHIINCCTGVDRVTFWECNTQVSSLDICVC